MRKILSLIICFAMLTAVASSCSTEETAPFTDTSATVTSASEQAPTESTSIETTEEAYHHTFQPKVSSTFIEDIYGKDMCDAWSRLVDAVLAGEDTFDCPNGHIYVWVIRDFPDLCFPVMKEIIEADPDLDLAKINGPVKFKYKVPKEEAAKKIEEFSKLVEGILDEVMRPEYTDLEKALALYMYFARTYRYDFDAAAENDIKNGLSYTSAYRLLTTKTGICCEIAPAYSYLLMQVGVDASVVICDAGTSSHEWSIINLNGKYYHIDPTWVLESWDNLSYFLMTDEQRLNEGGYKKEDFRYVSEYSPEFPPDYPADDKTFEILWKYYARSFDHESHILTYWNHDEENPVEYEFDYGGY